MLFANKRKGPFMWTVQKDTLCKVKENCCPIIQGHYLNIMDITLDGCSADRVQEYTYLGFVLDKSLNFESHAKKLYNASLNMVYKLSKIHTFIDCKTDIYQPTRYAVNVQISYGNRRLTQVTCQSGSTLLRNHPFSEYSDFYSHSTDRDARLTMK